MHWKLETPEHYDLKATVLSHGWVFLPPFHWENGTLSTQVDVRGDAEAITITVSPEETNRLLLHHTGGAGKKPAATNAETQQTIVRAARWMLRLDENPAEATPLLQGDPIIATALRQGAGRFLRAPSIWEEAVRVLCTTNIHWTGTIAMMTGLVAIGKGACPTPERVLRADPAELRRARLGYRIPYLMALARRFHHARHSTTPEQWIEGTVHEEEARQEIRTWPGFGPYATAHMMVQLGFYGQIPIDSEVRAFHPGFTDKAIRALYAPYTPWDFLAYKLRRIGLRQNWNGSPEALS